MRVATRLLRRLGAPVETFLERARLPLNTGDDPEALLPLRPAIRFLEDAAATEGIPDLAARTGLDGDFAQLGRFGELVTQSITLHEALQTAATIYPHYSTAERLWQVHRGPDARIHHAWDHRHVDGSSQFGAIAAGFLVSLVRRAVGPDWQPRHIVLQAAPSAIYRRSGLFGDVPIDFSPELTTIHVAPEVMTMPLTARPRVSADAGWLRSGPAIDFEGRLRQVVTSLLPAGYPDVHLIADVAGTSARTAQRWLAGQGTSYARIVEQERFNLAQRMLADPRQKVIDVAFELGYADPAHFTRAFRRWTGTTPRAFRRDHLGVDVAARAA